MEKLKNKKILGAAVIILIIAVSFSYFNRAREDIFIPYQSFIEMLENGEVESVNLSDRAALGFRLFGDETLFTTNNPRIENFKETLLLNGVEVSESGANALQPFMSIFLFAGAFFLATRMMNRGGMKGAMAFNAADVSGSRENLLNFSHIAGNYEAKESVADIVNFIKDPDKFTKYGARMPKGVIFYGPPGTGKTLMAKAIAGEAGVSFFAVSGSDFVQMYVGVGASRVRELFKKARAAGKAVIFIDEIDALAKQRATGPSGNDEREQTLNALLTEMSGFSSVEGIVVIAATNRLDTLDEALLRPGRFDRIVEIGLPDMNAREQIISHYTKNKPMAEDVNIKSIAKSTVSFSGAQLENLLNEAAIFAANRDGACIEQADLDKAYYTVIAGSEKKDRSAIKQRDKEITAYHEAGHALISKLVLPENIVSKVTIIPSTKGAGGFCVNIPPDKQYYTKAELKGQMMTSLAGRAAEEIIFGQDYITTGAGADLVKVSGIVKDYVGKYGMGENLYNTAEKADAECAELIGQIYGDTKTCVENNLECLRAIANELLDKETLNEEDLDEILTEQIHSIAGRQ